MKAGQAVAANVDEYLGKLSPAQQKALQRLRKLIRSTAPKAEEVISYHIPSYKYKGMLVGFGAYKDHCAFYAMSNTLLKEFRNEISGYDTAVGTIRFQPESPLPDALVKKIILAKMMVNEEHDQAKKTAKKK